VPRQDRAAIRRRQRAAEERRSVGCARQSRERVRAELKNIVDSANKHFCSDESKANTTYSSSAIVCDLKRTQRTLNEESFVTAVDKHHLRRAYAVFNDAITGHVDFHNPDRALLRADDPTLQAIRDAEDGIVGVCECDLAKPSRASWFALIGG